MSSGDSKAIYVVACISTASLIVSLAGIFIALAGQDASQRQQFRHRIDKRDVGNVNDCSDEALGAYDVTTSEGATSRHIHDLACKYATLRDQMESSVDEFNSMLFFINEISTNMQAARDKINSNEQLIFLTTLASDNAANASQVNAKALSAAMEMQSAANAALQSHSMRLDILEAKAGVLVETLQSLNDTLSSVSTTVELIDAQPPEVMLDAVDLRSSVVAEGNQSKRYEALNERSEQNSEHIVNIRTSIARLKSKLGNFASGWYNAPNGYQYFLSKNAFTSNAFVRSRRYCNHRGADLAHVGIRNPDVFRYLWHTFIAPARHHCVWVGMTDIEQEGTWKWIDGEPTEDHWTNWGPKLPGRAFLQDCGYVRAGKWSEGQCSGMRKLCSFICERKILSL